MKIQFYNKRKKYFKTEPDLIKEICKKGGIAKNKFDIIKIHQSSSNKKEDDVKYWDLIFIQNTVKEELRNWDSTKLYFEIF